MRCKHKNAGTVSIGRTWIAEGPGKEGRAADVRRGICLDCQAWLPLGPANDAPETALEVRAAKLAIEADKNALFLVEALMPDENSADHDVIRLAATIRDHEETP